MRTWWYALALSLPLARAAYGAPGQLHVSVTDGTVVLQNRHCRLTLDVATGGISSLRPGPASLRGAWFEVVEEDRRGLQPWETWKHGAEMVFSGGPAAVACRTTPAAATAVLRWTRRSGLMVEAEARLRPDDSGPLFRLTVANTTGAALVDTIRLPILRGIALGSPGDDWFTWPHTLGSRFRVQGLRPGELLEQPYPAMISMQWLDLYDRAQGVYVGCLDDYGYSKALRIGREKDGRSVMGITFSGCWIARKGDAWTTPWVQVAAHRGDWRAGADLYRAFAEKAFGPPWAPERLREMPTAQCWLAHHASDGDVGKLFEVQQQAPIHASYVMKSLNTSTPEGWDGMRGSGLEYHRAFDRIRQLGGSPALFTFDRAPLMGKPDYAEHVGEWTCRRRDGSFEEGFRDMMPSPFQPDFVKARVDEAVRWVREFGLDEIHYDTEATCGYTGDVGTGMLAGPSYEPGSGRRPNEVPHYFKRLYRETVAACRRYNPDFTLRAEHLADFFFPEFAAGTAHFLSTATGTLVQAHHPPEDAQLMPMLFRYTLPRHAASLMPSMGSSDFWMFGYGMGHGFHGGGQSWCFNPGVRQAESPPGELLHRYRFYDLDWRRFYDFRVGFEEAVVDARWSDVLAEAQVDGKWLRCEYPGPVVAATSSAPGRQVTLGAWYPQDDTSPFGKDLVGKAAAKSRPIVLRIPTDLPAPQVRVFGSTGEVPAPVRILPGPAVRALAPSPRMPAPRSWVVARIADPTCFAVEVASGPALTLAVPPLAAPGTRTGIALRVRQARPVAGMVAFELPADWGRVAPVAVPAIADFRRTVSVKVPAGIFGRNYPIKAVWRPATRGGARSVVPRRGGARSVVPAGLLPFLRRRGQGRSPLTPASALSQTGESTRTVATHLKVMEPLTVLYSFEADAGGAPGRLHCVDPGKPAWLNVTCVNNTPSPARLEIRVTGDQVNARGTARVAGVRPEDLGRPGSALDAWIEGKGPQAPCTSISASRFDCRGVPAKPVRIQVAMDGRPVFSTDAYPRTRVMDLDGEWKVRFTPVSRATVGGAERFDALDTEAVTPDVWDGTWQTFTAPVTFGARTHQDNAWGTYRRLVYVPAEWQGTDIWLRLNHTGAPWGEGGTLNLVYVNGWPAGRVGFEGECRVSPFLVFGGWNLLAVASTMPNSLVDPYLFVRGSPAPDRIRPAAAGPRPEGAFLLLGPRCTGQGLTMPFIQGVPDDGARRTNLAAGGENQFIYFAVADAYLREPGAPVEVEVEYLDRGTSPFGLDYDSTDPSAPIDGAFKSAPPAARTGTGEWRAHVFLLPDARFANREHQGSDFRIYGQNDDLVVRRIEVRKAQ